MNELFSIRVPASSANLGCLFDCGALALNLYLDLRVTPRGDEGISLQYTGVNPERVSCGPNNLIARVIGESLESWGSRRGFHLEIDNQIPVGVGLGSSAAAIVGGLVAAYALAGRAIDDEELVTLATRREGHPDNAAAAWHGGFTVGIMNEHRVLAYSCAIPHDLQLVLVIPNYALPTLKARGVLPAHYSRQDAIHNLQRGAVLAAQIFSGRTEFHRAFFDDRWHQPYRASLMPGLAQALAVKHPDLLGVCLSGAGPSVLGFARRNPAGVGELIRQTLAECGVESQAHILTGDNRGAKGWFGQAPDSGL